MTSLRTIHGLTNEVNQIIIRNCELVTHIILVYIGVEEFRLVWNCVLMFINVGLCSRINDVQLDCAR